MDKLTKYTQVEHLQKTNELVDKVNELKTVATSGSYNDLTDTPEEITSASKEKTGIVKVGENINVDDTGTISVSKDNVTSALGYIPVNPEDIEEYNLPIANDTTLGGVKIGSNINVAEDGTISLDENSVKEALGYTPLNADEGGTVNGDIDLIGGIYKINGEELESGINLLKRNKEYAAGDIAFSKSLNSQLHLKCITAGTTAEAEPENLSSKVLNDEFTDGTITWKVVKYTNQLENYVIIAKEDEIDESLLHENTIIIDPDEVMTPLDSSSYAMIGATDSKDGKSGFVPTPKAGDENKCLRGDGTWGTISSGINLLTRAKSYVYGDIAYSSHIPSWAYLYCVEAGTTAEVEPDLSNINTMGQLITDGTVQWIVDDIRFNYPVGLPFYDRKLRPGCVKINGATVYREDYKRIFNEALNDNAFYDKDDTYTFTGTTANNTTISNISAEDIAKLQEAKQVCGDGILISGDGIPSNCTISSINTNSITISAAATSSAQIKISYGNIHNYPYLYGWGDGSTTFVLPDYRSRVIQGGDITAVLQAGLPNISGSFSVRATTGENRTVILSASGALQTVLTPNDIVNPVMQVSNEFPGISQVTFNASYSSNVYGKSSTVQPPAISLIPQIKF